MFIQYYAKLEDIEKVNPKFIFGYQYKTNAGSSEVLFAPLTTVHYVQKNKDKFHTAFNIENYRILCRDHIRMGNPLTQPVHSTKRHKYFGVDSNGTQNSQNRFGVWQNSIAPIIEKNRYYTTQNEKALSICADNGKVAAASAHIGSVIQGFLQIVSLRKARVKMNRLETKLNDPALVTQNIKKEKEAEKMKTILAPQETLSVLGSAIKAGTQVAVADEAANAVMAVAEVLVGDAFPDLAKTEAGRSVAKLVAATLLHHVAETTTFIPEAQATKAACSLVMQASSRDLIQPKLAALTPVLASLAAVGKTALSANGQE